MIRIRMVVALAAGLVSGAALAQSQQGTQGTQGTQTQGMTLSQQDRTMVRDYVMKNKHPSTRVSEPVAVGAELPSSVQLYSIEGAPSVSRYRYTVVNDRTVLVDPSSRKIIEIIE